MLPDDDLCLCFHVSWRKVINFARINKVRVASQLSLCQSAGTGCGWCRAFMVRLVERLGDQPPDADELAEWMRQHLPSARHYSSQRKDYIAQGKGAPPANTDSLSNASEFDEEVP